MIDNLLTLLAANAHVYVDVAGLIWSYPLKEVHTYIQRIVEAGFEDRVMFGTDHLQQCGALPAAGHVGNNATLRPPEDPRLAFASRHAIMSSEREVARIDV